MEASRTKAESDSTEIVAIYVESNPFFTRFLLQKRLSLLSGYELHENNASYSFMGNVIIPRYFPERFALLNTTYDSRPFRNGYFPMRVRPRVAL
jgi:hypothetical protein